MISPRNPESESRFTTLSTVDEEIGQLVGAGGEGLGARLQVGIVLEQFDEMHLDLPAAGTGRNDDVVEAGELVGSPFSASARPAARASPEL